jgi:hypothetical protein
LTAQVSDKIIIGGHGLPLHRLPSIPNGAPWLLNTELKEIPGDHLFGSTACRRGYIATWELRDGKLYLIDIKGRLGLTGDSPIFANWVTDTLIIPRGDLLEHFHAGFGGTWEKEQRIKVVEGLVESEMLVDMRSALKAHNRNKTEDGRWYNKLRKVFR